jgi:hypothetical protein
VTLMIFHLSNQHAYFKVAVSLSLPSRSWQFLPVARHGTRHLCAQCVAFITMNHPETSSKFVVPEGLKKYARIMSLLCRCRSHSPSRHGRCRFGRERRVHHCTKLCSTSPLLLFMFA